MPLPDPLIDDAYPTYLALLSVHEYAIQRETERPFKSIERLYQRDLNCTPGIKINKGKDILYEL